MVTGTLKRHRLGRTALVTAAVGLWIGAFLSLGTSPILRRLSLSSAKERTWRPFLLSTAAIWACSSGNRSASRTRMAEKLGSWRA